jgi:bifunctional UDP-N-acetylglucosamine pyrophosphorylase/glucosamine-1-phosphate N-acetyltransferase
MTSNTVSAVILAAGKGTRMKSALPKVLHAVGGRPMVLHVLDAVGRIGAERSVVVIGPDMEGDVAPAVAPAQTAVQHDQAGTADAVKAARAALAGVGGTVLVLYGDTPLIAPETLSAMVAAREEGGHAVVVLGFRPEDPGPYGRLVTDDDGALTEIVEAKDASPEQLAIGLCNSGVMAVDGAVLFDLLDRVGNDNAKGEYYLTDIVGLARASQRSCGIIEADADELMGVNDRADLAVAEAVFQSRRRAAAMAAGVTLRDPTTVYFSWDTELGSDVEVEPHVVFGPGVRVGDGAQIRAYSHLEGAEVGAGAQVGPFARLRPGAKLGAKSRVGNFVEVKNAVLGDGAKANHLTYLGDAEIGAGANIGAGTITCNYDGFRKHKTTIEAGAFIGSDSQLVAPVTVGRDAFVGSGTTVTKDVPRSGLALARVKQVNVEGWADRFRQAQEKRKR